MFNKCYLNGIQREFIIFDYTNVLQFFQAVLVCARTVYLWILVVLLLQNDNSSSLQQFLPILSAIFALHCNVLKLLEIIKYNNIKYICIKTIVTLKYLFHYHHNVSNLLGHLKHNKNITVII